MPNIPKYLNEKDFLLNIFQKQSSLDRIFLLRIIFRPCYNRIGTKLQVEIKKEMLKNFSLFKNKEINKRNYGFFLL